MGRARSSSAAPALARRARRAPTDLCLWHEDSPNGWIVLCAIISQMSTMVGTALWHCIPNASKAVVQPLLSGFFLHLRVVQSTATGERRVLFTDIAKSFGMGNNAWQVHPAHRLSVAQPTHAEGQSKRGLGSCGLPACRTRPAALVALTPRHSLRVSTVSFDFPHFAAAVPARARSAWRTARPAGATNTFRCR